MEEHKEVNEVKEDAKEMKPKRNKVVGVISTVLILGGIAIILIPIFGKVIANKQQDQMLDEFYLSIENQSIEANTEINSELDASLIWGADEANQELISQDSISFEETSLEESAGVKSLPKPIGLLEIDKIDLKLAVAEGVDLDTLRFALGHMPSSAGLGEIGNSVVAGHRTHTFNTFFNRLDEVEVGDQVKVTNGSGETVTYEVYEKLFVDPTDTSVLNTTDEFKVLTLITCHPEINPTGRLILHCIDVNQ